VKKKQPMLSHFQVRTRKKDNRILGSRCNSKIRIYKTIILPVVLYWCETWSLTLKEHHRQRVFEVLRIIFGREIK
jgi:hypothetical protein